MTNEEWLNKKFGKTYDSIDAGEKIDYLLKQVEWMEENLCDVLLSVNCTIHINVMDIDGGEFAAEGSCLLEAIENAQEEMNNV